MQTKDTQPARGFWQTFWGMTLRPWRTMGELARDPGAFRKSVLLLLLIIAVYTLILAIFIAAGYPTAAPSALPLGPYEHYPVQIWYQGPLFLLTTAVTAGFLALLARLVGQHAPFGLAFARIAYASVIPFFFTTMLIEVIIALGMLAGVLQPPSTIAWLLGPGSWFANGYQLVALVWMLVLFVMAAKRTIAKGWLLSALVGLAAMIIYAIPVGLIIR